MNIETETPKPQTFVDNNKINAAKGISIPLFVPIPLWSVSLENDSFSFRGNV